MKRLWDPYAPQNIRNPYLMYDRMRSEAPVFKAQTGEWILTRYDDVSHVLASDDFIVGNRLEWMKRQLNYLHNNRVDFQAIVDAMHSFVVLLNPPQHTRVRELVSKAWSDHQVEAIIHENIDVLFNKIDKEFDLITDFAIPLPVMTICRIMGIEDEDYKKLKVLSAEMVRSLNLYTSLKDLVTISKASGTFITYFKEYIDFRKNHLEDDLVSKIMIANQNTDEPLTDPELISICIFLFVAGEETTVNLIGNGMLALFENEEVFNQLRESPELSSEAVNEFLRYDAPVQLVGRIAASDLEIDGLSIPRESTITLAIGAANRDPQKFDHPHKLSFDRTFKQNLAFGRGRHFCLGAWLAKVQARIAFETLITTFPTIQMKQQELRWNDHLAIRGLRSLRVEIV